ncbi:MAG: type VI secretion system baseplate subunit TssE [Gammaproteobacteria bacterium]|nr:type VI secretion system baseplate subunit TssE [Gammaproteobacteria bacterium]
MPELSPQERLQPSLLDRLTDNEPHKTQEPRKARVLSMRQLRAGVLRDLGWLLNSRKLSSVQDLDHYPLVASSVLNYGMPELTGHTSSSVDIGEVENMLRQCIMDYEPRIIPESVKVRAEVVEEEMSHNAVSFEIEGQLWAQPMPIHLFLKTEMDLEGGQVAITDQGG